MAETFKFIRAIFPRDKQRQFICESQKILNLSNIELSKRFGVCERTIRDWKNEKSTLPLEVVENFEKATGIKTQYNVRDHNEMIKTAASSGGKAKLAKYGKVCLDEDLRKDQWRKWWNSKGRHSINSRSILSRKSIVRPRKSKDLSELVGIVIGDGGISIRQVTITLHHIDDSDYIIFVAHQIERIFGVQPSIYFDRKNSVKNIVVSRTELVDFLVGLGLKIGNKIQQGIDIPDWIKSNPQYSKACLRGLIDTDGSVFNHQYSVNNNKYSYKKLGFTSASPSLISSVAEILRELDIKARVTKNGRDIRVESQSALTKYFSIVGTNNSKHLRRYKK